MFRERIDQTPFTTEEADYQFKTIKYGNTPYAGDMSLLATLRAMFGDRVGESGEINAVYRNYELSKSDSERFDDGKVLSSAVGSIAAEPNQLTIMELVNIDTAPRVMKAIREGFETSYPNWKAVGKVEAFFAKVFPLQCYINESSKSAILVSDRLTLRKWHCIQIALYHCFPWFFTEEQPFGDDDKKLLGALKKETPAEYLSILNERATKYDFEKIRIKRLLTGFETAFEQRRMDSLVRDVESKRHEIEQYNARVSELLAELRECNYKLIGLKSVINEHDGDSMLMDYFLADRKLGLESSDGGSLRFTVKGFIENYDEDVADAWLENENSIIYTERPSDGRISREEMKRLLTAIFLDRTITLRSCAAYVFETGGNRIQVVAQEDKRYPAEFSTYMPNPHIQNYGCMGTYRQIINGLLLDGDYVGSIVQCEVSCNSLNWNDHTVMGAFVKFMYRSSNNCFELPDGSLVDQVGAVAWLNGKETKA